MKYLVIEHVPLGYSHTTGHYQIGAMWLEDLRAMSKAIQQQGGELHVATPLLHNLDVLESGSFDLITIKPEEEGFTYHPLPEFRSFKQLFSAWNRLQQGFNAAIKNMDIVQLSYGGHPLPLGQLAWKHCDPDKVIWIFDGADPFPRYQEIIRLEPNPVKKLIRQFLMWDFKRFCQRIIPKAGLVFSHNDSAVQRFKKIWGDNCHLFPRTFVRDTMLLDAAQLEKRCEFLADTSRPLRLIVAGRQILIKATDHVLKAMKKAQKAGIKVELIVLGEGEDLDYFKQTATKLGLDDSVDFRGQVPYGKPLFDIWASCDAMVITNLTSEISRNTMLSMAHALPLIIYRNEGTDPMIEAYDAGYLIPRGDIDALSDAFINVAQQREKLVTYCKNGQHAASEHTLDKCHDSRAVLARQLFEQLN